MNLAVKLVKKRLTVLCRQLYIYLYICMYIYNTKCIYTIDFLALTVVYIFK